MDATLKTLPPAIPTPEQITVIDKTDPGYWLIQGSAGSGKTTTALLRLKYLVEFWKQRREDLGVAEPVRVLVLTFNRTLRGYIEELTNQQINSGANVELDVLTFGEWAGKVIRPSIHDGKQREMMLERLASGDFNWSSDFLVAEIDYVLGRWMPDERSEYLHQTRIGRGASPQVTRSTRHRLLEQVINPYQEWKASERLMDWQDLAVEMTERDPATFYDIVIVDEAQDFSANQVRAIVRHVADEFVCTFVRDTTQRIYPNFFTWGAVGVNFGRAGERSRKLVNNHRNTKQIAAFARPLVEGVEKVEDESLPNFTGCKKEGALPIVLSGLYRQQLDWTIAYLRSGSIAADDSIAFLHPKGGNWFSTIRTRLATEHIDFCELSRQPEWPDGDEQVALLTMHSAKGLEFDHVILLGYNAETIQHGDDGGDSRLDQHRRLLAMAIGRARKSVVFGYKESDAPRLINYFETGTYESVKL